METTALSEYTLTVQNVQVQLYVSGSGPPTLLLHGNPDSAAMWLPLIDEMTPQFSCFAPDLPGFGRSLAPKNFNYSLENMAAFIDELVVASGMPTPINLVVHDFGGPFGLAWAIRNSEKVRRLAIFNTLFFHDYRWHFWAKIWRTPLIGELSMLMMNRWMFANELRRGSARLSETHIQQTYDLITPSMKKMVLRLYRATDPKNFHGWDDDLLWLTSKVPTAVFWGMNDPYIPETFAERFGADHIYIYPESGHWLPVENVALFKETLRNFLE